VQPVTPGEPAKQLGIERERGPSVIAVEPASAAEAAGFQPRDVITEVNGQRVDSVADLKSAIGKVGVGWRSCWRTGTGSRSI
jgi:serine protease DegQ